MVGAAPTMNNNDNTLAACTTLDANARSAKIHLMVDCG